MKAGASVQPVMTPMAHHFITPLTLSSLTGKPVYTDFFVEKTGEWINHVHLAHEADQIVIAPLTAQTLAGLTYGHCQNLLMAIYLSATCPVTLAPAMDRDMYRHPAIQHNLEVMQSRGCQIIGPETGSLASGLEGTGRMAEPETILNGLK